MRLTRTRRKKPSSQRQRSARRTASELGANSNYSYSSRRSEEAFNVGRLAERPKIKLSKTASFWVQRFGLIILTIAVVAALINVLGLSSSARVVPIDSSSQSSLTPNEIQTFTASADKLLSRSIWNGNKITVNTTGIAKKLMSEYPQLDSVSVTIPLAARRPVVYIQSSPPAIVLAEPGNGAYVINSQGRAYLKAASPNDFSLPSLPVITDQSGLSVKLGDQVIPTTYINFIQEVVGQLAAKGYKVSSMTLPQASEELDVYIAGQPYYVKFNLENSDPRQQTGTFLATIAYLKSKSITPGKYVDVRVDGRAYYQ